MQNSPLVAAPADPLCVTLSMEEVYVLLRLLHGTTMPGLDLAPFELDARGIPSEPARRALAAATNSLIAHGIAEPEALNPMTAQRAGANADEPHVKLDLPAEVVALLGACAFGDYTLRLTPLTSTGAIDVYLHELRQVGVAHTIPLAGIHKFTGLHGREGILAYTRTLLGLEEQRALHTTPFMVPQAILYAARDAGIAGRTEEAARLLQGAGASTASAEEMSHAIAHARALGSATFGARAPDGARRERQFAFVVGKSACFIMTPGSGPDAMYQIQPTTAQQLIQHFQATLNS